MSRAWGLTVATILLAALAMWLWKPEPEPKPDPPAHLPAPSNTASATVTTTAPAASLPQPVSVSAQQASTAHAASAPAAGSLTWIAQPADLHRLQAQLAPHQAEASFFQPDPSGQTAVYELRLSLQNTGSEPLSFTPALLVASIAGQALPTETLAQPGFINGALVAPGAWLEGTWLVRAPVAAMARGEMQVRYSDDRVRLSVRP